MQLNGKTALVTGAAKRVGREIALILAQNGANILLHYNQSQSDAEKTAAEIQSLGALCKIYQADLEDVGALSKMMLLIEKENPHVDILVNSASIFYKTPLEQASETDLDTFTDIHLKAPFLLSKKFGLKMIENGSGKIINIVDWSAYRPYKDYAPYCASKGALLTLTKALARDLAPQVLVNAVAPGPVLLPEDFTEEEKQVVVKKTLLGRVGSPADIANAVLFLLENDFINGTVLTVDGGRSIV